MYTYNDSVMPAKTIYVKDSDLPLFEQAQQHLGDSISSMFAEFLRERVASLTPEENRIIEFLERVRQKRDAVSGEDNLPDFLDREYAEAERCAKKALKSFRSGDVRKTKALYYAANFYFDRAERDVPEIKEFGTRIAGMLGS